MKTKLAFALMLGVLLAQPTWAAPVHWTDWTSATPNTASGTITLAGGTSIGTTFTGGIAFAQLGGGTNYWTEGNPKPYTGNGVVDNAPTPAEMIALNVSSTNTITFSQAVQNPLMAIVSMGQYGLPVSYDFNTPFTVLSEGQGYWGNGSYELQPGDVLKGRELHAVIQFQGPVSSITWASWPNEYWHGITVGALDAAPVPEPATLLLMGAGAAGLAWRRRKNAA